jgi:hypothetical protein
VPPLWLKPPGFCLWRQLSRAEIFPIAAFLAGKNHAIEGFATSHKLLRRGTLAQLVEQRTFNPFVVGSTPAGPTKNLF